MLRRFVFLPLFRLRLVPSPEEFDHACYEARIGNAIAAMFEARGFTATHAAVTKELERLAKANRAALATEGWIA